MPDVVVNVVDASNLERNLYLTTQLIDMDIRVIVALNMFDELERKGDGLNYEYLGSMLGFLLYQPLHRADAEFTIYFQKSSRYAKAATRCTGIYISTMGGRSKQE